MPESRVSPGGQPCRLQDKQHGPPERERSVVTGAAWIEGIYILPVVTICKWPGPVVRDVDVSLARSFKLNERLGLN
jgi:hypothetical protein